MKVLAVSNFFPPHHVSGYALLCADVLSALRARGHEIVVLTGNLGGMAPEDRSAGIHRLLTLESPLDYYDPRAALLDPGATRRNIGHLARLVRDWQPDVVFVWGMWNLTKGVAAEAERLMPGRVVYYLANPWPIEPNNHRMYWARPTRRAWLGPVKALARLVAGVLLRDALRRWPLAFEHAPCCSAALRRQIRAGGVGLGDAPVVYEGIDVEAYVSAAETRTDPGDSEALSLVYVGLLVEHKGVHTAVEALARLEQPARARVTLTILGSGHPDYERTLRSLVADRRLDGRVRFEPPIPRADLPMFLARHHVLVLPSIWEEPLALIMQEGLASGLVVVGTTTGGTPEVVVDGDNGLLFPPGDAARLATQIERLTADPALRRSLARSGQATARQKFALPRMVDDLEAYLAGISQRFPSAAGAAS